MYVIFGITHNKGLCLHYIYAAMEYIYTYIIKYLQRVSISSAILIFRLPRWVRDILSSKSADPFKILYLVTISLAGVRQHVWVCISYGMWMGGCWRGWQQQQQHHSPLYNCCSKMKNVPSEHLMLERVCDAMWTHAKHSILKFYFSRFVYGLDAKWGGYMGLVEEGCSVP